MALNVVSSDRLSTNVETSNLNSAFGQLGARNVIQNGAAVIAQRHTTKASITGADWIVDRFKFDAASIGTYTLSQDSSGPPGFANSMKVLLTSAASPSAASLAQIMISLEGQDLQHFCKGTSSAKKFALSFWVKAKVTGTYVVELYDGDNTRQTSKQYSISSADTWEKKTVIFEADTTGAFDDDNAKSLTIYWKLAAGSNWTSGTLQTSWAANTNANRAVGQVNGMATNNDYFQMTGVQLEAGDTATDFEHRSYDDELSKCLRYYQVIATVIYDPIMSGALFAEDMVHGTVPFHKPMRDEPSMVKAGGTNWLIFRYTYTGTGSNNYVEGDDFNLQQVSKTSANVRCTGFDVGNNTTMGMGGVVYTQNASALLAFNAEL